MNKHQKYRLKDIDKYRKRKREYARTPEQRAVRNAYMKKWYAQQGNGAKARAYATKRRAKLRSTESGRAELKAKARENLLWKNYRITTDEYQEMLEGQGGLCLICGIDKETKMSLAVDHCHETGEIRGLLCCWCNRALGWFEKRRERIRQYLDGQLF